jgi:hypothetical protein
MYDLTYEKTQDGWLISGPTYRCKDEIKAEGGKWNPDSKTWFLTDITGLKERLIMQRALLISTTEHITAKCRS